MRLTLHWPPALNSYYRTWKGRILISEKGRGYRTAAALSARAQGVTPMEGELAVALWLYRPRRIGDIDGFLKATFDSLNGVAWGDDSQVTELHVWRRDDKANPRVELEVAPVATDAVAKELQAARPQILAAVRKEIADWTSLARPAVYRRGK